MIFGFWANRESSISNADTLPSFLSWRAEFSHFSLFTDEDVIPLLLGFGDDVSELYQRIRIPACKSDLARLVLLYNFGGLYIDAHCGLGSTKSLAELFLLLSKFEAVIFDKIQNHTYKGDIRLINSAMCARRNSPIIKTLADRAINNLRRHYNKEKSSSQYQPYNIFVLTGAWDISLELLDRNQNETKLKPEYIDRVKIAKIGTNMDSGFRLHQHYSYRVPGRHWSERQTCERLFDTSVDFC
jgi:hypothetical protein